MNRQKRAFVVILLLCSQCVSCDAHDVSDQASPVSRTEIAKALVSRCSDALQKAKQGLLDQSVDHAYVYLDEQYASVMFRHGSMGTFGDGYPVDGTAIAGCDFAGPQYTKLVYMSELLAAPYVDEPGADPDRSFDGSEELKFVRRGDSFEYCCQQKFSASRLPVSKKHDGTLR